MATTPSCAAIWSARITATALALCLISVLSHAQSTPKRLGILINGNPSPLFESIKKQLLSDFQALGYADGAVVIEPRFAGLKA